MNKYYKKLELDKILELLAEQTYSDACREKALKLKPSFDEEEIRTELKKTDDAFKLSAKFGTPRFRKIKDLSMSLRRCKSGSALSFRNFSTLRTFCAKRICSATGSASAKAWKAPSRSTSGSCTR